jgi:hypothetical protein
MAVKQFYAARDFKYGTRRLTAGDPVDLTSPMARVHSALGNVTDKRPRKKVEEVAEVEEPKKPAAPKAGAKARARKAKAKK